MILSNTFKFELTKSKFTTFFGLLIIALTLSGCAMFNKNAEEDASTPQDPTELYSKAKTQLDKNKYSKSLDLYNEFLIKFPFGDLSKQARLERIFILNELDAVEEASIAVNRFIEQYPLHPKIDYAYYLRGLVLFEKKPSSFLGRFSGAKEVKRNKTNFERSYLAFAELINKFPNSEYVPDAEKRLIFLRNRIANYEMTIANYYADRNAYLAAIKRAQFVIENFDQSPSVIDALKLIINSYEKIGLPDKADEARKLLESNYEGIEGQAK